MTLAMGNLYFLPFFINQTDVLAPTNAELVAPFDGYIEGLQVIVQVAVTTGGDVTVLNGAAQTVVAGVTVTVPDGAVKGAVYQDNTPTSPSATRQFKKGDRLSIAPGAPFATAGALNGNLIIRDSATISA